MNLREAVNNAKFTKGPWKVITGDDTVVIYSKDKHVCTLWQSPEEANLIAAAPDLLNAVKSLLEWIAEDSTDDMSEFDIAESAVKKALGL